MIRITLYESESYYMNQNQFVSIRINLYQSESYCMKKT